jgi:hypothetical protein
MNKNQMNKAQATKMLKQYAGNHAHSLQHDTQYHLPDNKPYHKYSMFIHDLPPNEFCSMFQGTSWAECVEKMRNHYGEQIKLKCSRAGYTETNTLNGKQKVEEWAMTNAAMI